MASKGLAFEDRSRERGSVIRLRPVRRDEAYLRDDARLLRDAVAGETLAQEVLFDKYSGDVERLLFRLLGNDSDIPDVMQEVFLQVFRHLRGVREPQALRGWIRAVTVATARKRIRSKTRRRWLRILPREELPDIALEADDDALAALRALYAVLDTMSVELRMVFALRYLEELGLAEIAEACEISLATAKRHVRKAEELFVARARRDPHLADWFREGGRWA